MTIRADVLSATIAVLLVQHVQAATLIPIPLYPNSYRTMVMGINSNNVFTGGYNLPGKSELGFLGTIDGNYTSFDIPEKNTTVEARAINDSNEIVGYFVDPTGGIYAFERFSDGSAKKIRLSKQPFDYSFAQGINSKGVFVADGDVDFERYSCYGKKGRCTNDLLIFSQYYSNPRGINDHGTVVGYATPKSWVIENGVSAWVTYPGALYTNFNAVNNKDIASGTWTEQDGFTTHAFLYDIKGGTFQDLKLNGLHNTHGSGVNDGGVVTINSDEGPFLYCSKKKTCPNTGIEVPEPKIVKARIEHSP